MICSRTLSQIIVSHGPLAPLPLNLVPALEKAPVEGCWAGLRLGTGDGFPFLGRVPAYDNVFVATGHFRSGVHLAPGTAVVMTDLLCGQPPAVDLTPFRIGRE